jgi:hypothetical protein
VRLSSPVGRAKITEVPKWGDSSNRKNAFSAGHHLDAGAAPAALPPGPPLPRPLPLLANPVPVPSPTLLLAARGGKRRRLSLLSRNPDLARFS